MSSGSLQWLTPQYALAMLPWMLLAAWLYRRRGMTLALLPLRPQVLRHPLASLLPPATASRRSTRLAAVLGGWAAVCLLAALAQPVRQGAELPPLPAQRDIVFLVDVSISMTLADYELEGVKVTRMEVLKSLLHELVGRLEGERLGLVVFAEKPYLMVPLSRDVNLLQSQLQRLTPTLAGRISAVGDALTLALKEAAQRPQRKQLMVLLTDADESVGRVSAEAAAQLAAEAKIPLYALAIGAAADPTGLTDQATDGSAGLIYASVNMALLEAIVQPSGGKVWRAHDSNAIEAALQEITQQHSNEAVAEPRYVTQPLYFWPLLAGLLPLLVWQLQLLWGAAA